jgi:hypothetical protein
VRFFFPSEVDGDTCLIADNRAQRSLSVGCTQFSELLPINADRDGDQRSGLDCEIPVAMPTFEDLSDSEAPTLIDE